MAVNLFTVDGWLQYDPEEIEPNPDRDAKRLCRFGLAFGSIQDLKAKNLNSGNVWCRDVVADRVLDQLKLKKGDRVFILARMDMKYRKARGHSKTQLWVNIWPFVIEIVKTGKNHEGKFMEDEEEFDFATALQGNRGIEPTS